MTSSVQSKMPLRRRQHHNPLREVLLEQIQSGLLRPGDALLSARSLCDTYGLSLRAVQGVIRDLIAEGWLYSKHRVGVYVSELQAPPTVPHVVPAATKKIALLRQPMGSEFIKTSFFLQITRAIESYLYEHGYEPVFTPLMPDQIEQFFEREAAHLGAALVTIDFTLCGVAKRHGVPCICLGELPQEDMGPRFDAILLDNESLAYEATNHLIGQGHQKIAHLAGARITSGNERNAGFHRAMLESGLEVPAGAVVQTNWQVQDGYQGMLQILARCPEVTAVFAATDLLVFGALRALHECGRKAPDDLSIVGFDDWDLAGHTLPPLTTVYWDRQRMGQLAGQLAVKRIQEPEREGSITRLPGQLVIRDSTRAIFEPESKRSERTLQLI